MLHSKKFNPLDKYVIVQTFDGEPKYEPKTLDALPLYDEKGNMIMVPSMKIPPNAMIEWLKTEYPYSTTEFIRHTQPPIVTPDGRVIYPPEVFECIVKLHDEYNQEANGFSSREDTPDAEFDPLGSARTSAFTNAMRMLGFGCDIKLEDVYGSLDENIEREKKAKGVNLDVVTLKEINDNEYIEVCRNNEVVDAKTIDSIVEKAHKSLQEIRRPTESKEDAPEVAEKTEVGERTAEETAPVAEVPEKPKKKRGRPRKTPQEAEKTPESEEKSVEEGKGVVDLTKAYEDLIEGKKGASHAEPSEDIPEFFKQSEELMEIASTKFEVEEKAPNTLKELAGKTFAELYKENEGVFIALTRVGYNHTDKVPYKMVEMAAKVKEAAANE